MRTEHLAVLKNPAQRSTSNVVARLKGGLSNLQDAYCRRYLDLHVTARLDSAQDAQKKRLTSDVHWAQLRALSALEFLQRSELQKLEDHLGELRSCPSLTINDLHVHTICPACGYLPRTTEKDGSAFRKLQKVTEDFDSLYRQWVNALLINLKSES
jgi:rubrerythrin